MSRAGYVPQYEDLTRLEKVVNELREVSNKGNEIKNNVVNHVDDIIRILNKEDPDYSSAVNYIDDFLQRYKSPSKEFKEMFAGGGAREEGSTDLADQEAKLIKQNKRLKQILEEKRKFNHEVQNVNEEYEQNIDVLIEMVQEKKYEDQLELFEYATDARVKIERERQKEWEIYEAVLKNEELLHKLNRALVESYKVFDAARE